MQCNNVTFFLVNIFKAFTTSLVLDAPVDNNIFFLVFLISFKNGKLLISPEEIFIKSTFSVFRNFRLSSSKGVAKNLFFLFCVFI